MDAGFDVLSYTELNIASRIVTEERGKAARKQQKDGHV